MYINGLRHRTDSILPSPQLVASMSEPQCDQANAPQLHCGTAIREALMHNACHSQYIHKQNMQGRRYAIIE